MIEYTNESLFPDLLAALREDRGTDYVAISGAKRPEEEKRGKKPRSGGEKRLKKGEREREKVETRVGKGQPIDGIVRKGRGRGGRIICPMHRASEPDGPLTGAN